MSIFNYGIIKKQSAQFPLFQIAFLTKNTKNLKLHTDLRHHGDSDFLNTSCFKETSNIINERLKSLISH